MTERERQMGLPDLPEGTTATEAMRAMIKYAHDGARLLTNAIESGKVDECVHLRATKLHSLALAFQDAANEELARRKETIEMARGPEKEEP